MLTFVFFMLLGIARASTNSAGLYLDCLVDFERYAEANWHTVTGTNRPVDSGYFGDGNSTGNGGIRGSCGVALSYAVLVHALPTDPKNPTRLSRIRQALHYAANTHVSGTNTCIDNKQWGHDWQTSLWVGSMGFACLLMQSNLPVATVQAVQRAVADEATYRAGIPPASGYVGDTKAEENGWNANIVTLAAAWLNTNTNASAWLDSAKKYLVNTYTVADTTGDPLASWVTTTTLYPSFALENHGFYYPLYQMVSGMSMGDSLIMARLANTNVAAQLQPFGEHNVLNVWRHLQHMVLDSGEFAFPSGLDWTLHSFQQNSYYAWMTTTFDEPVARQADARLAQLLRYRQTMNGDGSFFTNTEPNVFYMEAVVASRTAIAWLHHRYGIHTNGVVANPDYFVAHFPDIKLIAQQSESGFVSISYGPKIMALVEPPAVSVPTNVFMTTPRSPGIIGLGALGSPSSAQLISLTTNANGFEAKLVLQNGSQGSTEVYVKSGGGSVAMVEVPVSATSGSAAGSFCVGIENDPLIGGSRFVQWAGASATITNRGGENRNITNDWVCVSDRYGMAAGPAGYFNYAAASGYNRDGGAEDTLQFVSQNPNGPRYCVWFPGKNAALTFSNASQISWVASTTNAVLTFPRDDGLQQIAVVVTPPQPYAPYSVPVSTVAASSSQSGFPATNAADGNAATFWVSSGTGPGQGPTAVNPEWLKFSFSRVMGIARFRIAPRTTNGGYGPKNMQMLLNGASVYQGTMLPTTTLEVALPHPVYATNAQLLITSSYDPSYPTNSRNVQVVEVVFMERAMPNTFEDWALHQFTESELADTQVSGAEADPDHDGAGNWLEFITGGMPLVADGDERGLKIVSAATNQFGFRFWERKNLPMTREFWVSNDLKMWTPVLPVEVRVVQDLGDVVWREAIFTKAGEGFFLRIGYGE